MAKTSTVDNYGSADLFRSVDCNSLLVINGGLAESDEPIGCMVILGSGGDQEDAGCWDATTMLAGAAILSGDSRTEKMVLHNLNLREDKDM